MRTHPTDDPAGYRVQIEFSGAAAVTTMLRLDDKFRFESKGPNIARYGVVCSVDYVVTYKMSAEQCWKLRFEHTGSRRQSVPLGARNAVGRLG
jgi:hypothetical protein